MTITPTGHGRVSLDPASAERYTPGRIITLTDRLSDREEIGRRAIVWDVIGTIEGDPVALLTWATSEADVDALPSRDEIDKPASEPFLARLTPGHRSQGNGVWESISPTYTARGHQGPWNLPTRHYIANDEAYNGVGVMAATLRRRLTQLAEHHDVPEMTAGLRLDPNGGSADG